MKKKVKEFREEIDKRLTSLDRGKGIPGKKVIAQIQKKSKKRTQEDKEDLAAVRKALKEPGPNIPWEKVKKDLGLDKLIKDKKALAKEARRQSRMLRDDPQEREILEGLEKIADRSDWKG